jgi:hypothetical protein
MGIRHIASISFVLPLKALLLASPTRKQPTPGQYCNSNVRLRAAVTDSTAGDANTAKEITLCPKFFTSSSTRFFLYEAGAGANPGVPFRDNSPGGWCNVNQNANFFSTAGTPS